MRNGRSVRLSKCCIGLSEYWNVIRALRSDMLGMGKFTLEFENILEKYFKKKVIATSSGTAALHLALESLNLEKGSFIAAPSITYVATYQAITAAGYRPYSLEINTNTGAIDLSIVKSMPSYIKAIVPVLYAGSASGYPEILEYCKNHDIRVVADAAHAFGTVVNGKLVGELGDITCFSFDGIKNITCGEGGCIVTEDMSIVELCKDKRLLAVKKDSESRYSGSRSWKPTVDCQGWRYHMSNINASIGIAQFNKKDYLFSKRRELSLVYTHELKEISSIELFNFDYSSVVPHIFPVKVLHSKFKPELMEYLKNRGVEIGEHYYPNHNHDYFQNESTIRSFEVTNDFYERILTLPLHPSMTRDDSINVCNLIKHFFDQSKP